MTEEKPIISKNGLILIGITSIAIFIVGMILLLLGFNEAFYSSNSIVRAIFEVITNTGDAMFYIIIITIFYIVYDKKFTKNLLFSLLFSIYINEFIKEIVKDPRPSTNIDPSSETGYVETSYGFPSGHSQSAVAFYGYIGYKFKDKSKPFLIPVILSIYIFLVALSRIILGVHDLQDIIGGLLIGIGFLMAFIYLEPVISKKVNTFNLPLKISLAIIISVALFLLGIILFPTTGQGLIKNPVPYADTGGIGQVTGAFMGFSIGYLLENKYINYQPTSITIKQKIINLIIGLIFLLVVYLILDILISDNVFLRFIRYACLAFTVAFCAPLIFTKINKK
jgi:membrane-associated phospholipid phosphatase